MKTFEGFLNYFKKNKVEPEEGEWGFEHVDLSEYIQNYFRRIENQEERVEAIMNDECWGDALKKYANENLVGKKIRVKCIKHENHIPTIGDYKYNEFKFRRCKLQKKKVLILVDDKYNSYTTGMNDFYTDLQVWTRFDRKITPEDPYGEEDWNN